MKIWSVHNRLGELWAIQKNRPLTEDENKEFCHALEANMRMCWKVAKLKNLSLMASITNDIEYQHEICAELDKTPYGGI